MRTAKNFGQLAFDLGDSSPTAVRTVKTTRAVLFFALLPDVACMERAYQLSADLRREHALTEKLRPPSLLHMTLSPVAEIPNQMEDTIALAMRAGNRAGGSTFSMKLDEVFSFDHKKKHCIALCAGEGNEAFRMLHVRLARAMRHCGLKAQIKESLTPHMTLVYKGKELQKTKLAVPISLKATEFVLIRSHHGEGRHDYLGRWPLA